MVNDIHNYKALKFDEIAQKIYAYPEIYCAFDHVAEVYQQKWLDNFPKGTLLSVSGLDDGAEEFYVRLAYHKQYLEIEISQQKQIIFCNRFGACCTKHIESL